MQTLLEIAEARIINRIARANLETSKSYIKVQKVDGKDVETKVGRFIRSYYIGSGDGMTFLWEFNLDGNIITEQDTAFGSVSGEELLWFKEDTEDAEKQKLNDFVSKKFKCGTLPDFVSERTRELRRKQMEEESKSSWKN
jgi:hypothetical protein